VIRRVLPLVALVAAANFVMLVLAQANRSVPVDTFRLTERELSREVTTDRDSAIRLRLVYENSVNWQVLRNEPTMIALGFTCRPRIGFGVGNGTCGLARRAFVALEYDGRAWQALAARRAEERDRVRGTPGGQADYLDHVIKFGSRLVMIDASIDPLALRRLHSERNVIILPATARAWLTNDVSAPSGGAAITGSVTPLTTSLVASAQDRRRLLTIPPSAYGYGGPPRFTVDLKVGGRHEPWIQDVQPIDTGATPH
jgi:hypothetical protein